MEKVVISQSEIAEVRDVAPSIPAVEPKLPPVIPGWAKALLATLVLALPLLCLVAAVLRIALRNQPPRTKQAWAAYSGTLLIISGLLTSAAVVIFMSLAPPPALGNSGLAELDERIEYPKLPATSGLNGAEVSKELKPLVVVVSPVAKMWFNSQSMPSNAFGAGALLLADTKGYLFVTARHVVGRETIGSGHAVVASLSGAWATAEVVGIHKTLDLALLWMPRRSGEASFLQPVAEPKDGEPIFVIGHPQGLRYSLSSGMISREQGSVIQLTAPISPGNSGGPVYDDHGNLVGVVSSTMDKSMVPNAENLNFAVSSKGLLDERGWEFSTPGREYFERLQQANNEVGRIEDK